MVYCACACFLVAEDKTEGRENRCTNEQQQQGAIVKAEYLKEVNTAFGDVFGFKTSGSH